MRKFLLAILLLVSLVALAQVDTIRQKIVADSLVRLNYVSTSKQYLTVYVYGSRNSNGVLYSGNSNLFYYPITPVNIGIGVSHKWLGGSISVVSLQSNKSKLIDNYNFNINLNAYGRQIGADFVYTVNSGYYLSNYKNFIVSDDVDKSQPFVEMRMQRFMFNFVRIFNGKKYSLSAPVTQGETQKRSSSSFILNAGLNLAFVKGGDSSFVPSYAKALFEGNTLLQEGAIYSLSFMPGYGVTWVIKKRFFIGLIPSAGISIQYQHLNYQEGLEDHLRVSYKILGRFGAGYHSRLWTIGISVVYDAEKYPLGNNTYLLNNVGKVHARIGYKFEIPRWAKKYSKKMDVYQDKLEHVLPIY